MYGGGPCGGGPPAVRLGVRDVGGGLVLLVKLRMGSILCIEGSPDTGDIALELAIELCGENVSLPGLLVRLSIFGPSFWARGNPLRLGIGGGGCLDGGGTWKLHKR